MPASMSKAAFARLLTWALTCTLALAPAETSAMSAFWLRKLTVPFWANTPAVEVPRPTAMLPLACAPICATPPPLLKGPPMPDRSARSVSFSAVLAAVLLTTTLRAATLSPTRTMPKSKVGVASWPTAGA